MEQIAVRELLGRLVAEGRAIAPTSAGPVPMPPVLGDGAVDVAAALAESRDEERGCGECRMSPGPEAR